MSCRGVRWSGLARSVANDDAVNLASTPFALAQTVHRDALEPTYKRDVWASTTVRGALAQTGLRGAMRENTPSAAGQEGDWEE